MTGCRKDTVIRNHFDTLLSRYPAGLSRDAMLLIALQRRYKNKEYRKALSDVFAATDRYLQSPVMREAWAEFVAPYQGRRRAETECVQTRTGVPDRNVYRRSVRHRYRNTGRCCGLSDILGSVVRAMSSRDALFGRTA